MKELLFGVIGFIIGIIYIAIPVIGAGFLSEMERQKIKELLKMQDIRVFVRAIIFFILLIVIALFNKSETNNMAVFTVIVIYLISIPSWLFILLKNSLYLVKNLVLQQIFKVARKEAEIEENTREIRKIIIGIIVVFIFNFVLIQIKYGFAIEVVDKTIKILEFIISEIKNIK